MSARDTGRAPLDRTRAPEPAELRPAHFPEVQRTELPGGIPLLFALTPGLPVVSLSVLVEAGAVHEPAERAGLASLTGALLESGAGSRTGSQIAEEVESLGIQLSVGASWEIAHLDVTGIRSRIPAAFGVVGDLIRSPTFPTGEVDRLRGEQLAGIMQRRAEPRGLANEMASRFIFSPESPFSRPISGTSESVSSLTRDDVAGFHAARFSPHGASVLVVGEIDIEEAVELAATNLSGWVGGVSPTAVVRSEPRSDVRRIVIIDRPGSVQSEIRVGHLGVRRATPDFFEIVVMNAILGGAFSSRLNLNLREKHGFTYGVSSGFAMRRQPGAFLVSTAVQSEVTADAVREIFHEIDGIRDRPVSTRELDDARNYLAGTFPLALQTTSGVASRLTEIAAYDLPLDYFDHYRERILAVDADAVRAAARERVRPQEAVVVIVGDASVVRDPIEALGLGEVKVVQLSELP